MKVVVIGCTHAGTAAIVNTAKLYPDAKITVYERNDNISFLSCGIALYVGGIVKDPAGLFYCSPEKLADMGVITRMQHDVTHVNLNEKTINVRNLKTHEEFTDSYDKLIITTGSWPIIPKIEGVELENILLSKNFDHSNAIIEKAKHSNKIVVVGAGYIGVELVEAFERNSKSVTLVDSLDRVLSKYLDKEFTDIAENELKAHNIKLALGETVTRFEGLGGNVTKVITNRGEYEADMVILCIGFRPNTGLFKGQLNMLSNGAIVIDEYMHTSCEDVFAAGDSCAVIYNPTGKSEYIPLATNAVRMGMLAARNLVNPTLKYLGTQGTSGIKIYEYNIAATGMTESSANTAGIDIKTAVLNDNYRPEFMPTYESLLLKVIYDNKTHVILGAQIISKVDLTQSINAMSICIQNKMTIEELAVVDLFFQPHFNKPWNFLNSVALNAL